MSSAEVPGDVSVRISRDSDWFVAEAVELGVATQGGSESEAMENIAEAVRLHRQDPAATTAGRRNGGHAETTGAVQTSGGDQTSGDSFRRVRFKLQALGFRGISQLGNHAKFIRTETDGTVRTAILPHYTELCASVVSSILNQAGITDEEFASVGI